MNREAGRGNLPRSPATLVGRDDELSSVAALVRTHQLLTLSGVGGVGKTRLALAAAAELVDTYPDGVWLVELAPVGAPDAVPDAFAQALGVTPQGATPVIETVAEAVAGRRLLLVVDNCEHVLAAAAEAITQILARSGTPRVIATSRERLLVAGEQLVPVSPLRLEGGVTSDAVTLFVERAGTVRPGFGIYDERTADAVVEICETVDGLPLGIELAAARMAAMSATEVRDRLGDRFRLLTGPEYGPARQLTLQHAVAWSFDLLDDEERSLMDATSVFAGGFDLTALCAVADTSDEVGVLGLLDALVRKSLVVAHHGADRTRYSLFETIRAFADDRLAEAARVALHDRHASHFAGEAVARWERWNGPGWRAQVDWVEAELANLRSAFRWARDRGELTVAADVAAHAALMGFSVELFETIGWAESLLDEAAAADVRRLPRLYAAAGYACFVGRAEAAKAHAHRAAELEADPRYESCEPGYATFIEALGEVYCGNLPRYVELTGEVAALPGPSRAFAVAAYVDGLQSAGRVDEALTLTSAALAAAYELGNPYWVTYTTWIVGLALSRVEPQRALEAWDEGMAYLEDHDVRFFVGFLARDGALLHTSDGQLETALALFDTSIATFLRAGAVSQLTITLASLPALFERLGRPAVSGTLLGAMAQQPAGFRHVPSLSGLGERLRDAHGEEVAARWAATGAALDLAEAAAYAVHQIDLARSALAAAARHGGPDGLTARETQVLGLVAEGVTTREISERLFISAKTADNHIQHIYTKLGVTNRAAATRWAMEHGLVELGHG